MCRNIKKNKVRENEGNITMTKEECIDYFIETKGKCNQKTLKGNILLCHECYFENRNKKKLDDIHCYIIRFCKTEIKLNYELKEKITDEFLYNFCLHHKLKKLKRILQ